MKSKQQVGSHSFAYRENANGTVDSICLRCFRTVGTASSRQVLAEAELPHRCEIDLLSAVNAGTDRVKRAVEIGFPSLK
jgi:hypothetical protein